jgi:hypothetical protein
MTGARPTDCAKRPFRSLWRGVLSRAEDTPPVEDQGASDGERRGNAGGVEDLQRPTWTRSHPVPDGGPGLNARDGFTWCQRVISRYIKYQEPIQAPVPSHLTLRTRREVVTSKA